MSAVSAAQAALDRRAAVAALAGAVLGQLPLLWLIREALDDHVEACRRSPRPYAAELLLQYGGHWFLLILGEGEGRVVEECDANNALVRSYEMPGAALILHDAVKDDPVAAEKLLTTIERAIGTVSP